MILSKSYQFFDIDIIIPEIEKYSNHKPDHLILGDVDKLHLYKDPDNIGAAEQNREEHNLVLSINNINLIN